MGVLRALPAVTLRADPAGFRIIGALDRIVRALPRDLMVTVGANGHAPDDPHTKGRGFDVRTHDQTSEQRTFLLRALLLDLQDAPDDAPQPLATVPLENLATRRFFAQIEDPEGPNEHLHVQQRKGVPFPG